MTLRWVPGWNGLTEPEAVEYVAAVEAADGQDLEFGVARAINDFVVGCKNDGIWDAIKASCILAGARTLAGALVPLVGTAPTNFNFVSGDYNRETGLQGNTTSKYLDSNFPFSASQQNNAHLSVFLSANSSTSANIIGCQTGVETRILTGGGTSGNQNGRRSGVNQAALNVVATSGAWTGLNAISRSSSSLYTFRGNQTNYSISASSSGVPTERMFVFTTSDNNVPDSNYFNGRVAFYSIGESLDLAALDTRVTRLIQQAAFSINTGLDGSIYDIDTLRYVNAGYAAGGTLT